MNIPTQLQQRGINFVLIEKGCKKPFQKEWQNKILEFDNPELINHLAFGGNYGIRGGGGMKLVIVDFDDSLIQEEAMKKLPPTFMVKTGSGMFHLYYKVEIDKPESFKGFNENLDTLFDVQGEGKQVVGPGSIHPNGNTYEVINNCEIQPIAYAELKAILVPFDKKPKKEEAKQEIKRHEHIEDSFIDNLKSRVKVSDVLNWIGVNTSLNPTACPFHDSKGGKCLGFNNDTAHCFHCESSWNIFSLITDYKKVSFKEALEILAKIGNMEKELEESRTKYFEKLKVDKMQESKGIKLQFLEIISDEERTSPDKWGAASELLSEYTLSKLWLYTTKDDIKTETWVYKDGIYIPNGKSEIKVFLRDVLESYYSQYIYGLVLAKIETDTFIDADKFFKTKYPNEVCLLNGILNIRTLELKPYNPEKIFFNKMPVTFDLSKQCPSIDKFIYDILPERKDVETMYELCGFGLIDEYKFEKAFMFHGGGRNGKGKLISLFKRFFGIENCAAVHLCALKEDNFSLSELFGKRMNLAGDIGHQDLKETNMFKSLTGRDLISAKRKFLRDLHFQNYAKFVFACNALPMVFDLNRGFWDRWVLIDFPYTFVTKEEYEKANDEDKKTMKLRDEDILERISTQDEMSGLLNQALIGLTRLEDKGDFSKSENSEDLKKRWIRKSNSFVAFCWDNIEDSYDSRISKRMLRKKYAEYCKLHKAMPKSDFVIKKVLQEEYGAGEVKGQEYAGDLTMRNDFWEGIKFKPGVIDV